MKAAIVDDVPRDRRQLAEYVSRWAGEQNIPLVPGIGLFESGEEFLAGFEPGKYDVVFLDIFLNGVNGMETARRIRQTDPICRLIFTTITTEFAVESYEVDSSWYLVKPYCYETLAKALDRCNAALLEQSQFLCVPGKNGTEKLFLHQVAWTEYENRRVRVHLKDNRQLVLPIRHSDLSAMLLSYPYFCDCIKGILVNFEAVDQLLKDRFLLQNGDQIPISRIKYPQIREQFLEYSYAKVRKRPL